MREWFDDYDDYDENTPYGRIINSDSPGNITNVSMFRHYCNCHGLTENLLKFFNINEETALDIVNYCRGNITAEELRKNPKLYIEEGIERQNRIEEATIKNIQLSKQLKDARKSFCGVGTRQVKLILNRHVKSGDNIAKIIRTLLEIEDKNISAKDTSYHPEWLYYKKSLLISECVEYYNEANLIYGVQHSDNYSANAVMYFILPVTNEQVSFHTNIEIEEFDTYPEFTDEWDGLVNTTLPKLERCILAIYSDDIEKAKAKKKKF